MQPKIVIEDMQYLPCPKNNHHSEELSMICLQKNCSQHLLVCPICEFQNHQGHKVTQLKQFLISALKEEQNHKDLLAHFQQIESLKVSVKNQVSLLREGFIQAMYELQQKIQWYFNQVQAQLIQITAINSSDHITKRIHHINRNKSFQELHNLISKLRIYGNLSISQVLDYYVTSTQGKVKKSMKHIDELKMLSTFEKMKEAFEMVKEPTLLSKYKWSLYKAQKIQVNGLVATQTISGSNGQRFALMESTNEMKGDIIVGVKIRKLKGWIGVGICLHDYIATNSKYKFNYTKNYHGSYLISANGYSWSHSQASYNSALKSFIFGEGDLIKITYSPSKKIVLFQCINTSHSFLLEVIDPPVFDHYVPCVNMCNPGDQVQIVNDLY